MFEGNALIRCLVRIGVLDESRMRLDYILDLEIEDFLELQLQTQVFKSDLVQSIHHAHVLIRKRHIRVGKQIVNVPSFVVRLDSQKHIERDSDGTGPTEQRVRCDEGGNLARSSGKDLVLIE